MYFSIRDGGINDLKQILDIENLSFAAPWKEKDLQYELTENPVSSYLVAEDEFGLVIGFIDYWVTFDSSTIAQIAVHPNYRRNHIAEALLREAIKECYIKKAMTITLEVRTKNVSAIGLYHKCGFKDVVIKPHYYENGDDALYMLRKVEI